MAGPASQPAEAAHRPRRRNEARCLWGALVNRSRNLVRQGLMLFPPEHAALKPLLARWSIAFARALKAHLREDGDVAAGAWRPLYSMRARMHAGLRSCMAGVGQHAWPCQC